jgi:signal transduction histidine kinase
VDERWFRRAGGFAWVMVGLPMVLSPPQSLARGGVWVGAYLLFALAAWRSWLVVAGLCVGAMTASLCNGFEGTLLVLVALQIGRRHGRRAGLAWIAAQTALFGAGIAVHWSPRSALLLVPPYLGLQVLAYFLVRLLGRVEQMGRLAERLDIAHELHDALGHHLTALSLNLEAAVHLADGPALPPTRTAQSIARILLAEVRDVVSTLAGAREAALADSLRRMARDIPSPQIHLRVDEPLAAGDDGAHAILRCAQEIMTNAARHARAANLWIDVARRGAAVEISARDDGVGADAVQARGGLAGMRERLERLGGSLSIETRPGAGFRVLATLPRRGAA